MSHEPFCGGAHTDHMTCAEVAAWRARERANPNHCWYGRTGYHSFGAEYPRPDDRCVNEGCERTYGEQVGPGAGQQKETA